MDRAKRKLIAVILTGFTGIGINLTVARRAQACLVGTWKVRCPNGHDDTVNDVTCNHVCEKCHADAIKDGSGCVVCPHGHAAHVSTGSRDERDEWLTSFTCPVGKSECRVK
jgi:hypothetical protein